MSERKIECHHNPPRVEVKVLDYQYSLCYTCLSNLLLQLNAVAKDALPEETQLYGGYGVPCSNCGLKTNETWYSVIKHDVYTVKEPRKMCIKCGEELKFELNKGWVHQNGKIIKKNMDGETSHHATPRIILPEIYTSTVRSHDMRREIYCEECWNIITTPTVYINADRKKTWYISDKVGNTPKLLLDWEKGDLFSLPEVIRSLRLKQLQLEEKETM